MIPLLDPYAAIGWDFDGTLIDHDKADLMHAFIKAHPQKRHVIVTFRTHSLRLRLPHDLKRMYPKAPPITVFEGIESISNEAWEAFMTRDMQRRAGVIKGPLTDEEEYYVEWKGEMCKRLGLPVLVDDNLPHTEPGCEKHGIHLIHPDEL